MSKSKTPKLVKKVTGDILDFRKLPQFAAWILENRLEEYARLSLRHSREEQLPLLEYLKEYTDEELIRLGEQGNVELLEALAGNRASEFITQSLQKWVDNQLEIVDKDSIVVSDIVLISKIRRQTFRTLLRDYTSDVDDFCDIMREVDQFTAQSDIAAIKTHHQITKDHIGEINTQLEEQYKELLESQELAQMGSFYWDLVERSRSKFTPNTLRIFDLEKTNGLENFLEDVHPDDRQRLREAIQRSIETDGVYDCEYRYHRNQVPKRIWSRGRVQFVDGKPVSMKGTIMDITFKSELMEKLQEQEKMFKNAESITHIGNWSWDIEKNRITWSDEMYRIYGLVPQSEEITFERFMGLVHPDYRENRMKEIQKALDTGEPDDYLLKIVTPSGDVRFLRGKGSLEKNAEGKPVRFNGTCQDITLEHSLNQRVKEKEEYLNLLINNAPDAIVVIDEKSTIRLWNPKTEEIFGWKADEVLGRHLGDTIIPPRYREAHTRGILRYLATRESRLLNRNVEITAINKRNEELFVSLTLSELQQNGKSSFIGFIRDITREHETKIELRNKTLLLEQKNHELERTNKELESFNYAASHDLQEPLRKIRVFANRITEEELPVAPRLKEYLEKISISSARMQRLIDDLLVFSQSSANGDPLEETDLNELLEEAKTNMMLLIEETGTTISYTPLPKLKVVRFQFLQVFTNLLNNSIKYRKDHETPRIWIGSVLVPPAEAGLPGAAARSFVKISFADNGIGFDPQFSDRLFNLFSRLHGKGKYSGTGIGLAICKKVVQQHGGFITAESDGSSGSTFHIFLPETLMA